MDPVTIQQPTIHVQYFYKMLGCQTQTYIGRDRERASRGNTVAGFFASDSAAISDILMAQATNQPVPSYPWSIRVSQAPASPDIEKIISATLSRVEKDGFEVAFKNPVYSSLQINMGMFFTPVDAPECNTERCVQQHWIQLNSCDLTIDLCVIATYGKLETHSCETLGDFTTAVFTTNDEKNKVNTGG